MPLNPRYTFETFVVGPSNEAAVSACRAVAEKTDGARNPLFIQARPGLGKTHLLHAIGHYHCRHYPALTAEFTTTEHFIGEAVEAFRNDQSAAFRARYRAVDTLLMDDVDFVAGKNATAATLLDTIGDLVASQKQVIVCARRPPTEFGRVQKRFRNGFVQISAPGREERIAILEKKAQALGIILTREVADWLAARLGYDVRRLEGVLVRLTARASLAHKAIDLDLAKDVLTTGASRPTS